LDDIKHVLDDDLTTAQILEMFHAKQAELLADIRRAQTRLQRVEAHITHIERKGHMPDYEITLKHVQAQRVLSLRELVPTSDEIPALFAEIQKALKMQGINAIAPWIALYHHEGFRDTDLDLEIAVPVTDSVRDAIVLDDARRLTIRSLDAHERIATTTEDGHNESWAGAYEALGRYVETHQYEIDGAVREVYLTTPDDEAGWLVEIQIPLKVPSKLSQKKA